MGFCATRRIEWYHCLTVETADMDTKLTWSKGWVGKLAART